MNKITIERTDDGWIAYPDGDKTVSGHGDTPYKALDGLAYLIKFFN